MAFDSPAFATDGSTMDAELFRRAMGTLLSPAGGIVTPGDLAVAQQGSPNMSVQVAAGQVWIPGSTTSTQGPYYSRNNAAVTQVINASDATNPRIDTILAQVVDQAYAGAAKTCGVGYVAGTPTSGATLVNLNGKGAVPASSLVLAYVLVPALASSIVTADISNVVGRAGLGGMGYQYVNMTASGTAAPGQLILANTGITVTLPALATAGTAPIKIITGSTNTGASPVTVTNGGAIISGLGLSATSFLLGSPLSYVVLEPYPNGWLITSGQQDTGWVPLTMASGFTTSSPVASARLVGNVVNFAGYITNNSGGIPAASTPMATLPASIPKPLSGQFRSAMSNNTALQILTFPSSVAQVQFWAGVPTSTFTNGTAVPLDGMFYSTDR